MTDSDDNQKTTFIISTEEPTHIHDKTYFQILKDNSEEMLCKFIDSSRNYIYHNQFLNAPMYLVSQSNNKNLITLKNYEIKYTDRKFTVLGLSLGSTLIHYLRSNNSTFKLRWIIPYYVFYSLLLCRENLNPFI